MTSLGCTSIVADDNIPEGGLIVEDDVVDDGGEGCGVHGRWDDHCCYSVVAVAAAQNHDVGNNVTVHARFVGKQVHFRRTLQTS